MKAAVFSKEYIPPLVNESEILRYAGCRTATEEVIALMGDALTEAQTVLKYRLCFTRLGFKAEGKRCDFDWFSVDSQDLARNLQGCDGAVLFAATLGVGFDRLIAKYSRISPAMALMLQAIGAERIESLCDLFCRELAEQYGYGLRPRFSPGYGDLPLEVQREVFKVLDCGRRIGLCLNDSLLMSPTKSVTAFVGIKGE